LAETFLKKDFASIVRGLLEDLASGEGGRVAITDATEGSVVRTLAEAFSRELAVAYAQLDQVYQLGYLDTAHGAALDNVVALLGLSRRRGGYLQGTVTFTRATPAPEQIPIPQGTPVAGRDVPPVETAAPTSIPRGGTEATVSVRSVEPVPAGLTPDELAALTAPGVLDVMPRPLHGVEGVTNRVPLVPQAQDETDDELRERARHRLSSTNLGTPQSLQRALRSLGLSHVEVQEPFQDQPGYVEVVVGDVDFDDTLRERALRAIEETRPAGIRVHLRGVTWVWVQVEASLELDQERNEAERRTIESELQAQLTQYLSGLKAGESVRESKVRNLLASHDNVRDVHARRTAAGTTGSLLRAFVENPATGELEEQTHRRLLRNGDLQVGTTERAGVELRKRQPEPFLLKLEPPGPKVRLRAELQLRTSAPAAPTAPQAEAKLDQALRAHLARLEQEFVEQGTPRVLAYAGLSASVEQEIAPEAITSLRFSVVHERDGRVLELVKAGDEETLEARERLELGRVLVPGGGGGHG